MDELGILSRKQPRTHRFLRSHKVVKGSRGARSGYGGAHLPYVYSSLRYSFTKCSSAAVRWLSSGTPPFNDRETQNRRPEADNGTIVNAETKQPLTPTDSCWKKGVSLAYHEGAAKKAYADVTAFLKDVFEQK
jgi:hypothetical protein